MTGRKCGLWTVLSKHGNQPRGGALWMCQCECGTTRQVSGADLRNGKSVSCGCTGSRAGIGDRTRKHGETKTRLYECWQNMRRRCADTSDSRYGGKGVSVCDAWHDFATFRGWAKSSGYSDDLTIDRIDRDGNYCPENCRWADHKTQARNRSIVRVASDGTPLAEIAERHGVPVGVMNSRISSGGWEPEVAATWPVGKRRMNRARDDSGKYATEPRRWRR